MNSETALVLFSGGQDSTVCLAWALERFSRVETIGFDYGQRHAIELSVRARLREKMSALTSGWAARLGDDHMIKLDALAAISDTALTRQTAIEIADSGLPTTFVPGRNLMFFCFAGVELSVRARLREKMSALKSSWASRLGNDHMIKLDALAAISDTALTRQTAIEIADSGLPTTFVPGRNLVFFCFAGALAYRRGARHLVAGMCETDYSGYPDCRDDTIKAMQVALSLGLDKRVAIHTPLMWIDKAETFALAVEIGGDAFLDLLIEDSHSCYLGDRSKRHDWGYGCGTCPACQLRAQGFAKFMSRRKS